MPLQIPINWEKVLLHRAWSLGEGDGCVKSFLPVEKREIKFNRYTCFYTEWEIFNLWHFYSNISHQIYTLKQIRSFSWDKKQFTQPLSLCTYPNEGVAPQAAPGACQDPDAKLGKTLAATSGFVARSKGSCANRSGIASGSGLTHALLGHIFLLFTFVLSNMWGSHLLHIRRIGIGFLSDSARMFPVQYLFSHKSFPQ